MPSETKTPLDPDDPNQAKLIKILQEETGFPAEVLYLEADLVEDLGFSSLKYVNLGIDLNLWCNVRVLRPRIDALHTIQDCLNLIEEFADSE